MKTIQKYFHSAGHPLSKEFTGIFVIVLIFLFFPYGVRMVDSSAAPIDPGIYSAIILAISAILIFKAGTRTRSCACSLPITPHAPVMATRYEESSYQ